MQLQLDGKVALITGASSGFGVHFAKVMAKAGASVVLAARRRDLIEAHARDLRASGAKAQAVSLDLMDAASIAQALDQAGEIDILVNNAGVSKPAAPLEETIENVDAVLGANLRGALLMALETARRMRARNKGGAIINVASILGLRQGGSLTTYAISKAGVIQMTKQLALELARHDIRVNALAPGYFATDLNRDFFDEPAGQALIKRIPQRRLGSLEDLDGPLLLLASDASRYMTGGVLTVDGGHLVSGL